MSDVQLEEERTGVVIIETVDPTQVLAIPGDEKRVQVPLRIVGIQIRVRRSRQGGEGFADATASVDTVPFGFWSVAISVARELVEAGDPQVLTAVVKQFQAMLADGIDVMTLTERARPQRTIDENIRKKAGTIP